MKSNIKYSTDELLKYIELYLDGISFKELCEDYKLNLEESTFRQYVRRYLHHGVTGLLRRQSNRRYSETFKYQIVQEYLHDNFSYKSLAVKYNIPDVGTIRRWVIRYTEGKENRTYSPKPEVYQMKSRKQLMKNGLRLSSMY